MSAEPGDRPRTAAEAAPALAPMEALVSSEAIIRDALRTLRSHLGMDVAFVSEFADGRRHVRFLETASDYDTLAGDRSDPLEASYCQRVVDGRLPDLIEDALQLPEAAALPMTRELRIRTYLSVPVRLSDGLIYGTFCCFSTQPRPALGERERALMQVFGEFIAHQVERQLQAHRTHREQRERVVSLLQHDALSVMYQPIVRLDGHRVVALEALARFAATPAQPPDVWFRQAHEVGLGVELEGAALRKALAALDRLPPHVRLTLNVSPLALVAGTLQRMLEDAPGERLILELTEHAEVPDYAQLRTALHDMRARGIGLAVDDTGAGYASLRHILRLEPDVIKLDLTLVRGIDRDAKRRSLAGALIRFARETGAQVVAEGVETAEELATLRDLQADHVQGYLLGRPAPLEQALGRYAH
ncbi:MAG TPA: EAL domain-containing protein [Lysobacter sp.]|nr:EAL domain-containing protein [Lysobacter sp.]